MAREVKVFQLFLQPLLKVHRQAVLEERADFAAVGAMAIADSEVVAVLEAHHVRARDESILIDLVRVVHRVAAFSCE